MMYRLKKPFILKLMFATAVGFAGISPAWAALNQQRVRAFPGAEGFGAYTPGGRGGQVLFVTNLADYDPGSESPVPGSLRVAIETIRPRFVIFRVSGTIALKKILLIAEPYLTLAGQTAPGDGICIKNYETRVITHDVIIRHMRFRAGDEAPHSSGQRTNHEDDDSLGINSFPLPWTDFPTKAYKIHDVIFDHCSASWAVDECLTVCGPGIDNITVQWCIISETLATKVGPHDTLLRVDGNVSWHHNLYAHNPSGRVPYAGTYGDGNLQKSLLLDYRNNVLYDCGMAHTGKDPARINYVANYVKKGVQGKQMFRIGGHRTWMYVDGNYSKDLAFSDQWELILNEIEHNRKETPFNVEPVSTDTARAAYEKVLNLCGATLPRRDAVDARIVKQVRTGTGQPIQSQNDVGGWPELKSAPAPTDSDNDGMPDAWETRYDLNPKYSSDAAQDKDGDGYTNIEEWMNMTDPGIEDL